MMVKNGLTRMKSALTSQLSMNTSMKSGMTRSMASSGGFGENDDEDASGSGMIRWIDKDPLYK